MLILPPPQTHHNLPGHAESRRTTARHRRINPTQHRLAPLRRQRLTPGNESRPRRPRASRMFMRQGSGEVRQRRNHTIDMRRQNSRVHAADASVEEDNEGCIQRAQHMAMRLCGLASGLWRRKIARADEVLEADTAAVQGFPCFETGVLSCVLCPAEGFHDVCETGCLG